MVHFDMFFFKLGLERKNHCVFLLKEMADWTPSVLTEVYWKGNGKTTEHQWCAASSRSHCVALQWWYWKMETCILVQFFSHSMASGYPNETKYQNMCIECLCQQCISGSWLASTTPMCCSVAGCGEMGRGGECANLTVAGSPGVWAACWISLSMLACLNVAQMFLLFACGIIIVFYVS